MINLTFDSASLARIDALSRSAIAWHDTMGITLANDLAKVAEAYMKPLMHVRPYNTGKLEDSLTHTIDITGNDWTVNFQGLDYGNWVDVGQDYEVITAAQYGYKYFPVDRRFGSPFPARQIHAIGKSPTSPYDTPLKFSQKTADYLSEEAVSIAEQHLVQFLETVVIA